MWRFVAVVGVVIPGASMGPSPFAARAQGIATHACADQQLMVFHAYLQHGGFGGTRSGQRLEAPHAGAGVRWTGLGRSAHVCACEGRAHDSCLGGVTSDVVVATPRPLPICKAPPYFV